jgi:hypothetical protein
MTRTLSISQTGQNKPPPSRQERDAACSMDAGRKAVEEPIEVIERPSDSQSQSKFRKEQRKHADANVATPPCEAPIGLELETIANEFVEER